MKRKTLVLQDCPKTFTIDQDKAISPEKTVERFLQKLASLDLKILSDIKRIDNGRLDIPVYFSVCGDDAVALTGTKKQMGKGASPVQAKASACMELAERFSFFSFKNDPANFLIGDYPAMRQGGYPVLDSSFLLQSVHDSKTDKEMLEKILTGIPMQWTWATNMSRGEEVLFPFSWFYAINEFNGPSAGNTYEEAALQGICEIVERHVCSLINQQKRPTPRIDPSSVRDAVARELLDKFAANGIELYLNDFSLDTGICTIGALAIDRSTFPDSSEIVYTAGTTPGAEKALIRAVTEIAQLAGDFNSNSNYVASGLPKPLSMTDVSYLTEGRETVAIQDIADLTDNNIKVEVERCVESLRRIGMEVFMIDTAHPDLQIPALYTIVPGAHFRERSMIQSVGLFAAKLLVEHVHDPSVLEEKLAALAALLPDAYYLEFYRGRNLFAAGTPDAAVAHFDKALALHPEREDLPYIYSYKGSCLRDLGRYDDAIEVLEQGRREDDQRPDLHNLLGVCHFKKGDYLAAISHFERAVHLDPSSAMDYANLGVNYSRLDRNEEAKQFFTLALTLDPTIGFAREYLEKIAVTALKEQ
ncbi:MAG: YcaO-like family protein [Desulfocapsaceae bacterium]|nr:YcaO-like family protein [Desulfocapsaceae bacterium]